MSRLDPITTLIPAGRGIAGDTSWLIALGILALLLLIAWWSMRPARRATRAELREARLKNRDSLNP